VIETRVRNSSMKPAGRLMPTISGGRAGLSSVPPTKAGDEIALRVIRVQGFDPSCSLARADPIGVRRAQLACA
jgi:hypothetical protein